MDALVLETGNDLLGKVEVGEQRAFGNFDDQPLGREARFGQQTDDALRQPAVGELRRRNIDRNLERRIPIDCLSECGQDDLLGQASDFSDWFTPAISQDDFALRPGDDAALAGALDFLAVCRP